MIKIKIKIKMMGAEFLIFIFMMMILLPHLTKSEEGLPRFIFHVMDYQEEFRAGDIATIQVKILGNYRFGAYKHEFNPNISVNDKMGNTSYITAVSNIFNHDFQNWRIQFMPIMVGLFHVLITDENFNIFDASMHYHVTPGPIYYSGGIVSWMDQLNNFVAGMKATVLILPKDAFGNNVTSLSQGTNIDNFEVYATYLNGANLVVHDVTNRGWNGFGYLSVEFTVTMAGTFLAHVKHKNQILIGSPLLFTVDPESTGVLDVGNCLPEWTIETESFQLFSTMETFINQRDKYGNLVPEPRAFDFDVMDKGTNLSLPIGDLQFDQLFPGIQSFSFKLVEPGDFILMITDKDNKNPILNMPYEFSVFVGYIDGLASIVNGSGLNDSVAGEASKFSILLKDAYEYPSPLELERLRVDIIMPYLSLRLYPQIYPINSTDDTQPNGMLDYGPFDPTGIPSVYPYNNSARNWKTMSSAFEVLYVAEKSGYYEIRVFCGNIPLNDGIPFTKVVNAGKVNSSISRVVNFAPNVSTLQVNDIVVQLMDSFSNPVFSQASNLFLQIASINRSSFTVFLFMGNQDGTYTGSYLVLKPGTYEMCITFDVARLSPCPFGVHAYNRHYFPVAYNDAVSVWEDESIAFNPVGNDFYSGGNATVVEYQKPGHGSVLQDGSILRYTPYKGFFGNDSFMYTISDVNGNIASGFINICVLCIPPQFVSFPSELQANEDILGPKFGGFPGFEIIYSDTLENICVKLSAQHGTVFLSPLSMQLWDPMWSKLSVSKMEGRDEELQLVGRLEVINFALQSLQYIGDENFSGSDSIRVSTINKNGKNNLDVPVSVKPINDPPFINVPEFIILKNETQEEEGSLIFDRQLDKFNFSIGDPDHLHFPGNESLFRVMFSLEVSSGFFSTKLPAKLISTTELKLKNSKQWQPLQTFVEISGHFTVKAKGLRFRGTINECNDVLQQLFYHGDEEGGVLRVNVNDMGWYGCYPDCSEMMSLPLISEASVNLITRMPVPPLVDHSVEAVIVLQLIVLSSLTMVLLFFTCKCVIALVHEKKKRQVAQSQNIQLYKLQTSNEQTSSTDSSENVIPSPIKETGEEPSNLSNPNLHGFD